MNFGFSLILLITLFIIHPSFAAVEFISGFEIGDFNEYDVATGTVNFTNTIQRTGRASLRTNPTTTATGYVLKSTAFTDPSYTRFYFRFATAPGAGEEVFFCIDSTSTCDESIHGVTLQLGSDRQVNVYRMAATPVKQCDGTTTLNANEWYLIEIFVNRVGTDTYELKINGNVEGTCTGALDSSLGAAMDNWFWGKTYNKNSQSVDFYYDDIQISADGYPGKGQIIARQFKSGTSTYPNNWTFSGCATIDACWSSTPYNAAYAQATADSKQTGLVASFTEKISGYGREIIRNSNLISACTIKVATNASGSGNQNIIRILNGTETPTQVTVTSTLQFLDDGYWIPTSLPILNSMEAGMERDANTTLTVYDMWVMCDYVPRRIMVIQ